MCIRDRWTTKEDEWAADILHEDVGIALEGLELITLEEEKKKTILMLEDASMALFGTMLG